MEPGKRQMVSGDSEVDSIWLPVCQFGSNAIEDSVKGGFPCEMKLSQLNEKIVIIFLANNIRSDQNG